MKSLRLSIISILPNHNQDPCLQLPTCLNTSHHFPDSLLSIAVILLGASLSEVQSDSSIRHVQPYRATFLSFLCPPVLQTPVWVWSISGPPLPFPLISSSRLSLAQWLLLNPNEWRKLDSHCPQHPRCHTSLWYLISTHLTATEPAHRSSQKLHLQRKDAIRLFSMIVGSSFCEAVNILKGPSTTYAKAWARALIVWWCGCDKGVAGMDEAKLRKWL